MPRKNQDRHDFFVYKSHPFRPLYHGSVFHAPKNGSHIWLFRQRNVARLMASVNGCEYASFRDYVRLATGGKRSDLSERSEQRRTINHKPTLEELS